MPSVLNGSLPISLFLEEKRLGSKFQSPNQQFYRNTQIKESILKIKNKFNFPEKQPLGRTQCRGKLLNVVGYKSDAWEINKDFLSFPDPAQLPQKAIWSFQLQNPRVTGYQKLINK